MMTNWSKNGYYHQASINQPQWNRSKWYTLKQGPSLTVWSLTDSVQGYPTNHGQDTRTLNCPNGVHNRVGSILIGIH